MVAESVELTSVTAIYLNRFALALVRVLGALSLNPLLGSARVPMPGRVAIGVGLTLALFPPGAPPGAPVTLGPLEILGEFLLGLLAGFVVAIAFAAFQVGASLIGVASSLNLASTLDPQADMGSGPLEQFFSVLALLVFVQINGHHLFIAGLYELFQAVDVGSVTRIPAAPDALAGVTTALFAAGIKMALPVLAALLLADLALAILARVAPQLNLFALGLPAKVALGLGAIVISLPWILPRMAAVLQHLPEGMLAVTG